MTDNRKHQPPPIRWGANSPTQGPRADHAARTARPGGPLQAKPAPRRPSAHPGYIGPPPPVHTSLPQYGGPVQAKLSGSRHPGYIGPPPPVHTRLPQYGGTAQAKSDYKLTIGAYMHKDAGPGLPEEVAGHSFVSVSGPGGKNETWGFSPQEGSFTTEGVQKMARGVPGRVHRDDSAFGKPGVKTRTIEVSETQAKAALSKINQYKAAAPQFNIHNKQCSSFTFDVARAAGQDPFPGDAAKKPRDVYNKL